MFYMLANVHHQIATGEVLPSPDRFWHYLPDLPFGTQNAAASFQLELGYLISHEAPWSIILSDAVGTNILSLYAFLKVLSRNGPDYDSDDVPVLMLPHQR